MYRHPIAVMLPLRARLALVPFALLVAGCAARRAPIAAPRATASVTLPRVRVAVVARRTLRRMVSSPATLAPSVTASVVARAGGVASRLFVDHNDVVRSGQALALVSAPNAPPTRGETLRAPIDGTVIERRVAVGDPVEGGRTVLFTIARLDALRGSAEVPEVNARELRAGMPVRLRVAAMPDREFESAVDRVELTMRPSHALGYEFPVANAERALMPGMSAVASVVTWVREDVLAVPVDAVVRDASGARVFVAREGRAQARDVTTGITAGDAVEIAQGVDEGDWVIREGASRREGEAVIAEVE